MGNRRALLIVVVVIMVDVGYSDDYVNGNIGMACDASACRSGVANDGCCRAIEQSIQKGTCSCICVSLNNWGYAALPAKCSSTGRCNSCSCCKCQKIDDPIPLLSSLQ